MAIVHDDIGRRRFLSQAVMGFGMLFGLGTLGLRFLQFLVPTGTRHENETVLIGAESRLPMGDAVLMDLHMPVMDGLTAIRLVRQAEYRGVIIAVTATDDARQSRLALDAGADDFVVKPVEGSQLCDRLRRLIGPRA